MKMSTLDWLIIAGFLAGMVIIALKTNALNKSVADFLAANRAAGRYLLTMASGMAGLGAISIAANFEKFYEAGFAGGWWAKMLAPLGLVMALTGFVIYRYRETRAMTMAQFFEMRYSRKFRIFTGMLAWVSGLLNYGIFPAVTARFLVYFTGLPPELQVGPWTIPTIAPVMAFMLSLALILTLSGGQIAVMVTDFFQGQFVNIVMLAMVFVLFTQISWGELIQGLQMAPEGQSKINPLKQADIPDFNVWFFLILAFMQIYGFKAWQGSQGYNAAARTPHEAKMAGILGEFRGMITYLIIMLLPIFMYALMHLPQFAAEQQAVHDSLSTLGDEQLRKQMLVPVALSTFLPIGMLGLFAAVIISAAVSTDDTYLHSWGSIFIQDVVMPFRKEPLDPATHMLLLRLSIVGVAIFAFCFSMVFPLHDYILMYFKITGAIYLGGAGSAILGGLYWKRGSTGGAWAGMITGSVLAVSGIVLNNIIWPRFLPGWKASAPDALWLQSLPDKFPLNGIQMAFLAALASILMYVIFSLLSRKPVADMDKLLHRGKYAVEKDGHHPDQKQTAMGPVSATMAKASELHGWEKFWRRIGVNKDFTRGDKAIYVFKIVWSMLFFVVFLIGTAAGFLFDLPDSAWITWWAFFTGVTLVVGGISVIWFLVGGFIDLKDFVHTMRTAQRDARDDGWVDDKS